MKDEITSILLFPPIKPTESVRGYMYRTAQTNAHPRLYIGVSKIFDNVEGFMQHVAPRDRALKNRLEARLASPATPAQTTRSYFHLRLGEEWIPKQYFLLHRRKICPICLSCDAWSRCEWELKSLTVCALHKVELVSQCPTCHRDLAWISSELLRCSCGQPLAKIKPIPASIHAIGWASRIQQAVQTSIQGRVTTQDRGRGPVQIRLSKLLLMAEIVRSVVLPRHLKYYASADHLKELTIEVLEDAEYRPYLWETIFLYAAADPHRFSEMLQLGQAPEKLARNYSGLGNELTVPRSLRPLRGPVLDRPLIVLGRTDEWKAHLNKLKRFYQKRLEEGRDPFSPMFPRGMGEAL